VDRDSGADVRDGHDSRGAGTARFGYGFDTRRERMAVHDPASTVVATVEVTLWVPRGAAGDLRAGTQEVLDGVDAVRAVEAFDVETVRPTATDIRLDLAAELRLRTEDVETALTEGFGVLAVTVHGVENVEE